VGHPLFAAPSIVNQVGVPFSIIPRTPTSELGFRGRLFLCRPIRPSQAISHKSWKSLAGSFSEPYVCVVNVMEAYAMNLKHLRDDELLTVTKDLVQMERTTLTKILHHLREIERRKLYSDLGCASLFEYAVKHLQYSEGQAGRRIQAMRLIKEIPEIEQKIASGALSLSNISQAQSFFFARRLP